MYVPWFRGHLGATTPRPLPSLSLPHTRPSTVLCPHRFIDFSSCLHSLMLRLPISLCHLILIIIYLYSLPSFPLDLLYIVLLLFFQPLNLLHCYGLLTFRLAETKTFVCLMVLQCRYSLFCRAKPFVIQYLSDISFRAPLLKTPKHHRQRTNVSEDENENKRVCFFPFHPFRLYLKLIRTCLKNNKNYKATRFIKIFSIRNNKLINSQDKRQKEA